MRLHLEGPQFEQAKLQADALRREEFIYAELGAVRIACDIGEEIAEQSVHDPGRTILGREMAKSDFQLIQGIDACFIHARTLAGRADINSGKQVRQ